MDIDQLKMQLGRRLKAFRLAKGMKQEDLETFGFSYRHYGKIERGQVNPTLETLLKLCDLFNVSLSDLFSMGNIKSSDLNNAIVVQVKSLLKENDKIKLQKIKIFLDEIL